MLAAIKVSVPLSLLWFLYRIHRFFNQTSRKVHQETVMSTVGKYTQCDIQRLTCASLLEQKYLSIIKLGGTPDGFSNHWPLDLYLRVRCTDRRANQSRNCSINYLAEKEISSGFGFEIRFEDPHLR